MDLVRSSGLPSSVVGMASPGPEVSEDYPIYLWLDAVRHAERALKDLKGVITAFNVNIDALHYIRPGEIENMLSGLDRDLFNERFRNPPDKIDVAEDLLAGLLLSMKTGRGMEWIIRKKAVSDWINENFQVDEYRMGGLAGITANVLARLGVGKIYPHVASLPRLQAELFEGENIKIPTISDGFVAFEGPLGAVREYDEPLIHWIFEYHSGMKVHLGGGEYIVTPNANRFIAAFDDKNTRLHIDDSFVKGIGEVIEEVDLAIISGYHLLSVAESFAEKINFTKHLFKSWKKSSGLKIHLELAYFTDLRILSHVLRSLSDVIDGLGMNEDELIQCLSALSGKRVSVETANSSEKHLIDGLIYLMKALGMRRMVVHTRDFCVAISDKSAKEDILHAMAFGNLVAAAKALSGRHCGLDEIRSILSGGRLHVSDEGVKALNSIANRLGLRSRELLRDGSAEIDDYRLWFIPTLIVDKPLSTVGLGDCFTAGYCLLAYRP